MKNFRMLLTLAALLLTSGPAQPQTAPAEKDMPLWEFRQIFVDLGSYLDANKGTDFQTRFAAVPDSVLQRWFPAVKNPRQLQSAVAGLKERGPLAFRRPQRGADAGLVPLAVSPACPAGSIIDVSPGAPCTPAFPDPGNSSWQSMVNPLITIGAFSPDTSASFADVSSQECGLTTEANLELVTVVLAGLTNVGAVGCNILESSLPFGPSNACFVDLSIVALADKTSAGLYSSCQEQDSLVNGAEIDANFRNTVTIYNALKFADNLLINNFSTSDSLITNLGNQVSTDFSNLDLHVTNIANQVGGISSLVSNDFSLLDTHVTNINNQVTGEFGSFDTHLTNVNNHVASEFSALDAHLVSLVNQLGSQIGQGTAFLGADARQLMKLQLTPDGQKIINPAILTCTGANCPNVLAACPAAGCSWNNVGPLP